MGGQSAAEQQLTTRHNFHVETENMLNSSVSAMFNIAYTLDSVCYFYERDDVAMLGMARLFRHCRNKMLDACHKLMGYICARGGKVTFSKITEPERHEWDSPLKSLEALLGWKKELYQGLLRVNQVADKHNDEHLKDYLDSEFMEPTLGFVRKLGFLIVNLSRAGPGLGEYQFDKHLKTFLPEISGCSTAVTATEGSSLSTLFLVLDRIMPNM
jgi:ferritin heavy chain